MSDSSLKGGGILNRKAVQDLRRKTRARFVFTMQHPRMEYIDAAMAGRIAGLLHHWDQMENIEIASDAASFLPDEEHKKSQDSGGDKNFARRQHMLPKSHLKRFAEKGGRVWTLMLKGTGRRGNPHAPELKPPASAVFCASRLWSQHAEGGWMRAVENLFDLLRPELDQRSVLCDPVAQQAITDYWSLCRSRVRVYGRPPRAYNFPGFERVPFEGAQRDRAERLGRGIYSKEGDETRYIAEALIVGLMTRDCELFRSDSFRWIVVDTDGSSFVLPDLWNGHTVPVSPTRLLLGVRGCDDLDYRIEGYPAGPLNEVLGTRDGANFIVSTSREMLVEIQGRRNFGGSL